MAFFNVEHDIRSYDPKDVRVNVAGIDLVGFSKEKVSIRKSTSAWKIMTGCEGETTRARSKDASGTITVTLQQSSPSNGILSALYWGDQALAQFFPVMVYYTTDLGKTKVMALKAWIERLPELNFSGKLEDVVWTFRTDSLYYWIGGDDKPGKASAPQSKYGGQHDRVIDDPDKPFTDAAVNSFIGADLPFVNNDKPYNPVEKK